MEAAGPDCLPGMPARLENEAPTTSTRSDSFISQLATDVPLRPRTPAAKGWSSATRPWPCRSSGSGHTIARPRTAAALDRRVHRLPRRRPGAGLCVPISLRPRWTQATPEYGGRPAALAGSRPGTDWAAPALRRAGRGGRPRDRQWNVSPRWRRAQRGRCLTEALRSRGRRCRRPH